MPFSVNIPCVTEEPRDFYAIGTPPPHFMAYFWGISSANTGGVGVVKIGFPSAPSPGDDLWTRSAIR